MQKSRMDMDIPDTNLNDMNYINFSPDLSNQLDTEEGLLSLSFDNVYGCDSENSSRSAKYHINEELRVSPDIIKLKTESADVDEDIKMLEELKLKKKLQQLILCNLDLIQYQSEQLIIKDKMYEALKQENEMLKNRLKVIQELFGENQSIVNPPPLLHVIQQSGADIEDDEYSEMPAEDYVESNLAEYTYDEDVKPSIVADTYKSKVKTVKNGGSKRSISNRKSRIVNGKTRKRRPKMRRRVASRYRDCDDNDDEEEKFLSSLSKRRRRCSDRLSTNAQNATPDCAFDVKIKIEPAAIEYDVGKSDSLYDDVKVKNE